jgi:hypothetical protein
MAKAGIHVYIVQSHGQGTVNNQIIYITRLEASENQTWLRKSNFTTINNAVNDKSGREVLKIPVIIIFK